jgi:hypothetical protein
MVVGLAVGIAQADSVKLKNGTTVEGKIVEQTDKGIKLDIGGVTLTYYTDEVESVVKAPASPEAPAAQAPAADPAPAEAAAVQPSAPQADELDGLSKEQLIRKFVAIYGVKENMQANFDQMAKTLKPEQVRDFQNSIKVDEIIEQLLPVYDKHFSEGDLKAYIRFYASAEGKKLVTSLPLLMQDSVGVSMKYLESHLPDSLKQPSENDQAVAAKDVATQ